MQSRQNQGELRRRRCTFHVIYWEASSDGKGVDFEVQPLNSYAASSGQRSDRGPGLCERCSGIVDPWRHNLDLMHASVRMLAKEGTGFREEVEDFVCLSPKMAIEYQLQRFKRYNAVMKTKVLTESTILSAPLKIRQGTLDAAMAGVDLTLLEGEHDGVEGGVERASRFLSGYAARVRRMAVAAGGVSALVVPHPHGVEVSNFGVKQSFFAHNPDPPITQVILLVAGPEGFSSPCVLRRLEASLMNGTNERNGCHVGALRLAIPSVSRSYAALGDLFMCHDREILMPIIEDLRLVGEKEYSDWMQTLHGTMSALSMAFSDLPVDQEDPEQVQRQKIFSQKLSVVDPFEEFLCHELSHVEAEGESTAKGDGEATFAQVLSRIRVLQDTRSLPGDSIQSNSRAKKWYEESEPAVVLRTLEKVAQSNCELEKRWDLLGDLLEKESKQQVTLAVAQVIEKCNQAHRQAQPTVPSVPEILWRLPSKHAFHLIEELGKRALYVSKPLAWLTSMARHRLGEADSEDEAAERDRKKSSAPKQPSHPPPAWALSNLRHAPRMVPAVRNQTSFIRRFGAQLRQRVAPRRGPSPSRMSLRRRPEQRVNVHHSTAKRVPPMTSSEFQRILFDGVEELIKTCSLDSSVAEALLSAEKEVKMRVLAHKDYLKDYRGNTSALVQSIMQEVKEKLTASARSRQQHDKHNSAGTSLAAHVPAGAGAIRRAMEPQGARSDAPRTPPRGAPSPRKRPRAPDDSSQEERFRRERGRPHEDSLTESLKEGLRGLALEVERFLSENGVDKHTASVFREQHPHVIQAVLQRGPLTGARDSSSLLMGRIEGAREQRKTAKPDHDKDDFVWPEIDADSWTGNSKKKGQPFAAQRRKIKRTVDDSSEVGRQAPRTPPMSTQRQVAKPKAMPKGGAKRQRVASSSARDSSAGKDGTPPPPPRPPPAPRPLTPLR